MIRLNPTIFNGQLELIISETFCCDPSKGVKIKIPLTVDQFADFQFEFITDPTLKSGGFTFTQDGNTLKFINNNFLNPLGTAMARPFEFHISSDKYFLQMYGSSPSPQILCLTISIYKAI